MPSSIEKKRYLIFFQIWVFNDQRKSKQIVFGKEPTQYIYICYYQWRHYIYVILHGLLIDEAIKGQLVTFAPIFIFNYSIWKMNYYPAFAPEGI